MSDKHACTTCDRTDPTQCHAGQFCAWDGEKVEAAPADKSGPTLSDSATSPAAPASGPSLSDKPAKRSIKGLFLLAAAGLAGLVALKACENEQPVTPTPTPAPAPIPVDPTPQAFQLWILDSSQPLCREGTITDSSCRARVRLAEGSCVQPFTDYDGGNQGQWVRVTATLEDGTTQEGLINRSKTSPAPAGATERTCFAQPVPAP